jgi:hypothetical protein
MPVSKDYSWSLVEAYRRKTFRFLPKYHLRTREDAVRFVNERGFVFFWPISGFDVPSLWGAVAGDRPVPNQHDDPAHITWRWKDDLLGKGVWYYAKVLRQKSTMISLDLLPFFYALSPNFGDPEQDYLIAYQDGKLTLEEKQVYETILDNGPLDSIMLRNESRLSSKENNARFSRALNFLMRDFRILPVGVAEAGTWNYAFVYDAVHRHFPDLPERAREINESEARRKVLESYFYSVGASQIQVIRKLFQWPERLVERTLEALRVCGVLVNQVKFRSKEGEWWLLSSLASSK